MEIIWFLLMFQQHSFKGLQFTFFSFNVQSWDTFLFMFPSQIFSSFRQLTSFFSEWLFWYLSFRFIYQLSWIDTQKACWNQLVCESNHHLFVWIIRKELPNKYCNNVKINLYRKKLKFKLWQILIKDLTWTLYISLNWSFASLHRRAVEHIHYEYDISFTKPQQCTDPHTWKIGSCEGRIHRIFGEINVHCAKTRFSSTAIFRIN